MLLLVKSIGMSCYYPAGRFHFVLALSTQLLVSFEFTLSFLFLSLQKLFAHSFLKWTLAVFCFFHHSSTPDVNMHSLCGSRCSLSECTLLRSGPEVSGSITSVWSQPAVLSWHQALFSVCVSLLCCVYLDRQLKRLFQSKSIFYSVTDILLKWPFLWCTQ